ncbi:MAG TPA: phosphoribosyltransferase family protein [Candidatus Eisenbacteria bacterium]|nr:phosphoribosyltransferase family protein [Candidatus Eisenbacteria bacterium]
MSATAERVRAILEGARAIITGSHIVYTSGRHGSAYVNKDAVYPDTARVAELCRFLADAAAPLRPEIVCGPAMGGIILAQWTGHHLGIPAVYAEKADAGGMALRRGYDALVAGRRVLVVEDILNTGGSVKDAVAAVRAAGGDVAGVAALVNRGRVTAADVGVPALAALLDVELEAWDAAACPLCRDGVPVNTTVGKGREFLAKRRQTG